MESLRWNAFVLLAILACGFRLSDCFNLTLLHTNDVHSHFMEFNVHGGRCVEKLKEEKKCFGGFARQVTKVKEIRSSHENTLFLNGGDFYQGTVWYTLHRWQIVAELVNTLNIDAMSLGNHEFDDGIKGLMPYLKHLKTKVVVCNINSSRVPEFAPHVTPSTILEVGGERIGVIGYLTPETKFLSSTGDLEFEDEVECIRREAHRLTAEEGLTKIIAVGHSGFTVDQNIAKEVPEIDIVVGGHTNTFLYSGPPPSVEEPQGPYPVVVEREDGSKALVVQDFAFGKYMGFLEVHFDDEGKITHWTGNPILLDASVPEDPEILELLHPYGQEVKRRGRQGVGQTNVLLKGDRLTCRMRECNLGNFLADASLNYFIEQPTEKGWNFVSVALWNSGGIRSSIDERINEGNITFEDIITVAPFGNTMDVVALKGKYLRQVLEASVRDYDLDSVDPPGSFLQVSGLRLTYNVSEPIGSRLIKAYVRCADCRVPRYNPLEDEEVYWVVMSTYMAKGGDGFALIQENTIANRNTDELDIDIINKYVQKFSPVITGLEDRITVVSARDAHASPEQNLGSQTEIATTVATEDAKVPRLGLPNMDQIDSGLHNLHSRLGEATSEFPFGNATDDALHKLHTGMEDASDKLQTGSNDADDKLKPGFQDAGDKLQTDFKDAGDKIQTGFKDASEKLKPGFQDAGDKIQTGFKDASDKLKPGLQDAGDKIQTGFKDASDKLKPGLQDAGDKIQTGFKDASDKLKPGFQDAGDKIQTGFKDAADKLQTGFKDAGDFVRDKLGDLGKRENKIPDIGKLLGLK